MLPVNRTPDRRIRHGTAVWWISPGAEEIVVDDDAPDWLRLATDPRAVHAKEGAARQIWRVQLSARTVYAKAYGQPRSLKRVLDFLGWSSAWREWALCRKAEARGISVICPLAAGARSVFARLAKAEVPPAVEASHSVFLSEGEVGSKSLFEAWRESNDQQASDSQRRSRMGLINAAAKLFAGSHNRGFFHRDAHPTNVLVTVNAIDGVQARFADVLGARLRRGPLGERERLASIAQIDQYFQRHASRSNRLRFLRSYERHVSEDAADCGHHLRLEFSTRRGLAGLFHAKVVHARVLARRRDRRLRRNGKYFKTISLADGWKATISLKLERRHRFEEREVPDRSEADWRAILGELLASRSDLTDLTTLASNNLQADVMGATSILDSCRSWPSRVEFERNHHLRHRDIPGHLYLAHVWQRRFGRIVKTILIQPRRSVPSNE